jgi:hypothetical protein
MTTTSRMGNRRILVIDDNTAIHEDFRKILADNAGASALTEAPAALFDDIAPPVTQEGFEGSTFHFTVRFKVQPPPVAQPSRADLSSVRGLRVLIVDDNATYR